MAKSDAMIVVEGNGVKNNVSPSLSDVVGMKRGSHTYFSRGKETKEAYSTYTGVPLIDILKKAGLHDDAKKAVIIASDGYRTTFSIEDIKELPHRRSRYRQKTAADDSG